MRIISKKYILCIAFLTFIVSITAQNSSKLWVKSNSSQLTSNNKIERRVTPKEFEIFNLDLHSLKVKLQNAPKKKNKSLKSNTFINFPSANGELKKYEIFEASILEEKLQQKFPDIKSYIGKSVDNSKDVIRFSVSKIGLHAMLFDKKVGAIYIEPFTSNKESYIIYSKKNLPTIEPFVCHVESSNIALKQQNNNISLKTQNANDGLLRTFRLAIATTGEYSQFQLIYNGIASNEATEVEKKEVVLAAINATMTRVNAIFERDVSLTMELVASNDEIIFLDPDNDPFTNNDGSILINESQETIDDIIGSENYDIGHTFSTGGGGLAQINSPCTTSKAKGVTGSSFPIGDTYDLDFVAHEMGHQFGANHTFNSDEGSCADGNRNNATAIEPGSGSTIMAYAGLCAPENVQNQSDDYFHLVSIQEIWRNISSGSSNCATTSETGNSTPNVEALESYTIPISTPFVLTATATDTDNDQLTYTWEQIDNEIAMAPPVSTSTEGPSFRSTLPTTNPSRYFPDQNTVISGNLFNTWEVLPSVGRTMDFSVTVRDNNINGGQTASQETTITFDESSGPFEITSQTTTESWNAASLKTITWDVANTNIAPVNCTNVNILLSVDGGFTFPFTLASNVDNNGTYEITVPNTTTTKGRIKVESSNNIFYDINNSHINIQAKEFSMDFNENSIVVCKPTNAIYAFTYSTYLDFNEETTFSATENPTGTIVTFSPTSAVENNTLVEITVSGIDQASIGNYEFNVIGTSGETSMVRNETIELTIYEATLVAPTLLSPLNNSEAVLIPYELQWSEDENAVEYEIQIATDNSFNSIIEESLNINSNSYTPTLLQINSTYFWRVKAVNGCGESNYSEKFSFATAEEICSIFSSIDTPIDIPDNNPNGGNSFIKVSENKVISDVNVFLNITHPYTEDLAISLVSPNGITILLSASNGDEGDNYTNTTFDDDASIKITDGSAPFTGIYKPQIPLAYLNDIKSVGNWTLNVIDSGLEDIGTIDDWSIQICGIPFFDDNDEDGDGVVNEIDQCPNTTPGSMVDEVGCFILPSNNFEIETVGETCTNKENGQIIIKAQPLYNYFTNINDVVYNFTGNQIIDNLPPGTYDFCIVVEGETYEQCFSVNIVEGSSLSAKASVKSNEISIDIFKGSPPFKVSRNGSEIFETQDSTFSITIEHGDLIEVKTAIECEGVFSTKIDLLKVINAYPNPTNGFLEITLPTDKKEVFIELYSIHSQLFSTKKYPITDGKIQLNIENISTGIYFIKLQLKEPVVLKIIKN